MELTPPWPSTRRLGACSWRTLFRQSLLPHERRRHLMIHIMHSHLSWRKASTNNVKRFVLYTTAREVPPLASIKTTAFLSPNRHVSISNVGQGRRSRSPEFRRPDPKFKRVETKYGVRNSDHSQRNFRDCWFPPRSFQVAKGSSQLEPVQCVPVMPASTGQFRSQRWRFPFATDTRRVASPNLVHSCVTITYSRTR